ncbi:MAG: NERD domain-containing protein [Desulfamplus sp.]|nr:NERD domain-containing protein [Desulfamplus sp.]
MFDKLRESFVDDSRYFAFHSLNLTKHDKKKFGEADFVIICHFGVFVLEVKGGSVLVNNGSWHTINRKKEVYHIQNPFKQAESALHAVKNEIKSSNLFSQLKIPIGYGVIFPDVEWRQCSSEWDMHTICDSKKMRNFEAWLKKFFIYWSIKPSNNFRLSDKNINDLKQFLRPDFELVEPLYSKLLNLAQTTVKLTEEQYIYLDIVVANNRVLCSGGAGTGKTFLAAELVRRMACESKIIGLVCKSNWLKRYLETKIINEFVIISTINSLNVDMRRSRIDKYDVLIVDEGQDLFNIDDMNILNRILKGGLQGGEWYIFHDINNQAGLFSETKLDVFEILESYQPAKIPLTTNCRNSVPILKKVQERLGLDMGNRGTGEGPDVVECICGDEKSGDELYNNIREMLNNSVPPGSITILSPFAYAKSSASFLPESIKKNIINLDDYSIRSFPPSTISFAEIKNFKGLENDAIILIDLDHPENLIGGFNKTIHYVAMSRARALLCIIWNK